MEWATRRPGQAQFNRFLYEHSADRISTLLGLPGAKRDLQSLSTLTRYGLGSARTLEQLIEFTGVDLHKREVVSDRCEELKHVPFTSPADPFTDPLDVWGGAPEVLPAGSGVATTSDSVTIFPLDAFNNAYIDALTSDTVAVGGGEVYPAPRSVLANLNSLNKIAAENLNTDAQYVREKVKLYVGDAKFALKEDMVKIKDIVRHRGK